MPSLMAMFGLDGSGFKAGLDKGVAQAAKAGGSLESKFFGALKQSRLFELIASPIGVASSLFTVFAAKMGSSLDELLERAKAIKKLSSETNLNKQQTQTVMYAAQGAGIDPDASAKAILKIAEAQEKVRKGGPEAAKTLAAFSELGVTLEDIKSKSYDQLFFQIAGSLDVAKQTGAQLTAGVELMGKSFESLEPMWKRGFSDPLDQVKQLTDEELRKLDEVNMRTARMKSLWSNTWQNMGVLAAGYWDKVQKIAYKTATFIDLQDREGNSAFQGMDTMMDAGEALDQDAAMKRNQAKIDARKAKEAEASNKAAQKKFDLEKASADVIKKASAKRLEDEKLIHSLRMRHGELNQNQRIGGFAGSNFSAHLSVAQQSLAVQQKIASHLEQQISWMKKAAERRSDDANNLWHQINRDYE